MFSLINYVDDFRCDWRAQVGVHGCMVCHKLYPSEAELQQHLRTCINKGRKLNVQVKRLTDEQLLTLQNAPQIDQDECELCGERLKSAQLLITHTDAHFSATPGKIKCTFVRCVHEFSSPQELKEHHKKHWHFTCDVCGKLVFNRGELTLHIKRHSQLRPHACDFKGCSYSAKVEFDLYQHKRSVHSPGAFSCHQCGRAFDISGKLKRHLKSHETANHGVIKVQRCKKTCSSLAKLKHHKKATAPAAESKNSEVVDDCVYECRYCSKVFKDRLQMRAHSMRHETDTLCIIKCVSKGCKQIFSSADFLKKHIVLHKKVV